MGIIPTTVCVEIRQIAIALERGIAMRPIKKELDKMNVPEKVKATDAQLHERAMVDIKAELATLNATIESGIDYELARGRDVWTALSIVSLLKAINNPAMNTTLADKIIENQRSAAESKESDKERTDRHALEIMDACEKSCIATRFRVGIPFVEEYGDSELDHWSFQSEYFECLSDAISASKRSNDYDPPVIHFEVFDPATKEWEHLFDVPVESAENIEVVSDL